MKKYFTLFLLFILLYGCNSSSPKIIEATVDSYDFIENIHTSTQKDKIEFVSGEESVSFTATELPLKNIMVESSAAIAFLSELDALSVIKGVTEPNYIYNPKISLKIHQKEMLDIGNSNELYLEIILKNRPQLLIATTNPLLAKYHQQLKENGIQILYLDEYKEQTPLAQAEYLKIIGKLVGKEEIAIEKYKGIKTAYEATKKLIQENGTNKTSTLVNTMMGDAWYIPKSTSIQVQLIEDAKGNYIFMDQQSDLVSNFSFEEVYVKAKNATHWINVINYTSLAEMKASNEQYSWLDAYKNGNIYNYTKRKSKNGALDIYETGIVRPDIVLKDLGKIFHPELFKTHEFYFYQQLK